MNVNEIKSADHFSQRFAVSTVASVGWLSEMRRQVLIDTVQVQVQAGPGSQ